MRRDLIREKRASAKRLERGRRPTSNPIPSNLSVWFSLSRERVVPFALQRGQSIEGLICDLRESKQKKRAPSLFTAAGYTSRSFHLTPPRCRKLSSRYRTLQHFCLFTDDTISCLTRCHKNIIGLSVCRHQRLLSRLPTPKRCTHPSKQKSRRNNTQPPTLQYILHGHGGGIAPQNKE